MKLPMRKEVLLTISKFSLTSKVILSKLKKKLKSKEQKILWELLRL